MKHDVLPMHRNATPSRDSSEDTGTAPADLDQAAAQFLSARPTLFGIAYRHLRNAAEAEDVVQDVWLRWHGTDRSVVRNPTAFMATTATRLAINVSQSAHKRHVVAAGSWVAESKSCSNEPGPEAAVESVEAVELAALALLEKLTPAERAAYVLREAFGYPYRDISEVLKMGAPNARQLVRRAGLRIASDRRQPVLHSAHRRLVDAFIGASQAGNLTDLEELLAHDIAS